MESKTADRDIQRRKRAEHPDVRVARQRNFFVRLAKRRLFECLSGLDDAARERDLSAMALYSVRSYCEDQGCTVRCIRIHEQQSRRVPDACGIEAVGPLSAGLWRESRLRCRTRKARAQGGFESTDSLVEQQDVCHLFRARQKDVTRLSHTVVKTPRAIRRIGVRVAAMKKTAHGSDPSGEGALLEWHGCGCERRWRQSRRLPSALPGRSGDGTKR